MRFHLSLLLWLPALCLSAEQRRDRYGDPLPPGAIARLGSVSYQQIDEADYLAVSPNGNAVAIVGYDDQLRLQKKGEEGAQRLWLGIHPGRIYGMTFSHNGQWLAYSRSSGILGIWDVQRHQPLFEIHSTAHPFALAFSPQGQLAATSTHGLLLCDIKTGAIRSLPWKKNPASNQYRLGMTFSPNGRLLALGSRRAIQILDVKTGKVRLIAQRAIRYFVNLAFLPDNRTVVGCGHTYRAHGEMSIQICDAQTGKQLRTVDPATQGQKWCRLAVAANGKTFTTLDYNRLVVWSTSNGKVLYRRNLDASVLEITTVAPGPRGHYLAAQSTNGAIAIENARTGKRAWSISLKPFPAIVAMATDRKGQYLVAQDARGNVLLWNRATLKKRVLKRSHLKTNRPLPVAISPSVIVAGTGSLLQAWNPKTGKELWNQRFKEQWVTQICFSPQGDLAIATTTNAEDSRALLKLNPSTGKTLWKRQMAGKEPAEICFSRNGQVLIDLQSNGKVALWDAQKADPLRTLTVLPREPPPKSALSQHGSKAAAIHVQDRQIQIWDLERGWLWRAIDLEENGVELLTGLSLHRPFLAVWPRRESGYSRSQNPIRIYEIATGARLFQCPLHDNLTSLHFAANGNQVFAGLMNGTILVFPLFPQQKDQSHSPQQLCRLLGSKDPKMAYAAMAAILNQPEKCLPVLNQQLQNSPSDIDAKIQQAIKELVHRKYVIRQRATEKLKGWGHRAFLHLQKQRNRKMPLEQRRRIEQLLKLTRYRFSQQQVQDYRAIQTLERIDNDIAIAILTRIAKGSHSTFQTREAQSALQRLSIRPPG